MTNPIHNDGKQYRLVFPGNILPGSDLDEVVFDLARLLKTSPDSAIKLVSGKRRHVKRTFAFEKADQLRAQVLELGVECELESYDPAAGSSKSKKHKRKKSFPKPESVAMQAANPDEELDEKSAEEKSYSETMAEFQRHTIANRQQKTVKVDLDDGAISFISDKNQNKADQKSTSLERMRQRLAQFVGLNVHVYLPKFDKFQKDGNPHFVFTWHWPAFFVPFFWAIYRKLWGWSVVMFISTIFWPVSNIFWGTVANYIYYRHSLRKIKNIRKSSPENIDEELQKSGGTSNMAIAAALLVVLILMNGLYWTNKFGPVFSVLNENIDRLEMKKSQK
jgi:hypothetical protein